MLTRAVAQFGALHVAVMLACLALMAVAYGVMLASIWAHRRSVDKPSEAFHQSIVVELVWAAVPGLIAAAMAALAVTAMLAAKVPAKLAAGTKAGSINVGQPLDLTRR